jgi:outer membrane protein assembly factor BamB
MVAMSKCEIRPLDRPPPKPTQLTMRLLLLLLLTAGSPLLAQEWPQWRGPQRNGSTTTFTPPAAWPDRPKQIWKVQVGEGHASPVVAAGRAYLLSRIGEQEVVSAREVTNGRELWRQVYDAPYEMNPAARSHGKGPKSTPVLDAGRLFTFGVGSVLSAWQAQDGRLLWRKDFKKDFKTPLPDFGVAMSPIVAGDLVIVYAGGSSGGALTALDVASGAVRWTWKGDGPAYSSPVVAEIAGVRQVITLSHRHVVGVALGDGRLLWQIPFTTEYDQNSVSPIVLGDLVIYGGLSKPTTASRIVQTAGKWSATQAWQNADVPMYMSSPVEAGGFLYGLTHRSSGQFFCLDARSGKTMWTTRGREGENASMIAAGGYVMAMTTEGELVVARSDPKQFAQVKRYTIADSAVWASLAAVGNGLLVKDVNTLAYWVF